jgi:hypothetical protein
MAPSESENCGFKTAPKRQIFDPSSKPLQRERFSAWEFRNQTPESGALGGPWPSGQWVGNRNIETCATRSTTFSL